VRQPNPNGDGPLVEQSIRRFDVPLADHALKREVRRCALERSEELDIAVVLKSTIFDFESLQPTLEFAA